MTIGHFRKMLIASAGSLVLTACGGGGDGPRPEPAPLAPSTPTPTPTPTPAATLVKIFATPTAGEFASVGVSTNDTLSSSINDRIRSTSTADADQPHIRYNSGGYYEIELPGAQWDQLIAYKGLANPDPNNNYFQPASVAQNLGYLATSNSRDQGYSYSEMASWGNRNLSADHGFGFVAFGVPTAPGLVPITGTGSYSGTVNGTADIPMHDLLLGSYDLPGVGGTVSLSFDFGAGILHGSMALSINGGMNPTPAGTYTFTDTVFSPGNTTYSGKFDTTLTGQNFFLGRFTGPHAEETIGAWAVPFTYSVDGQTHQAIGAWIAKSH